MRQALTVADEPFLILRSLSVNYAAGARIESHAHGWPQLLYAANGSIRARIGDGLWFVPPRRAIWIPAGTPHVLDMEGRVALRTLYFRPGWSGGDSIETVHGIGVNGLLHEAIMRVCDWGSCDERSAEERRLADLIAGEIASADALALTLRMPSDRRARRLAEGFLDADRAPQKMGALLREAGLSRRTAERLFLAETGVTPAQWRRMARLAAALEQLMARAPVDRAAIAAGYESRSAFSDAFRRFFGETPGAMARQARGLE